MVQAMNAADDAGNGAFDTFHSAVDHLSDFVDYDMSEYFVFPAGVACTYYMPEHLLLPGLQCVYCMPDTFSQLWQPCTHLSILRMYITLVAHPKATPKWGSTAFDLTHSDIAYL